MILNINEVIEFKNKVSEKFNTKIHFHDSCGGQCFSVENRCSDELKAFIEEYFKSKGGTVSFNADNSSFNVK